MSDAVNCSPRLALRSSDTDERKCETFLCLFEKAISTPVVDEVFEARFLAIRPAPMLTEDADHRRGYGHSLFLTQQYPRVRSKLAMPCDTAQKNAEVNTCGNGAPFAYAHTHETDVVGVSKNRD